MNQRALLTEPDLFKPILNDFAEIPFECFLEPISSEVELCKFATSRSINIVFTKLGLPISKYVFDSCKFLSIVATPTTGLDHIDIEGASQSRVKIISLRGETEFLSSITSTAEHAWALLLNASRDISKYQEIVRAGRWSRKCGSIHQLSGKTIGIIGFGRLGKIISEYARAFRMKILVNDINSATFRGIDYVHPCDLDSLLISSDYVILAASYNANDLPILTSEKIKKLQNHCILVNISRGELLDESALLTSLQSNQISYACLDVLSGDSRWSHANPMNSDLITYHKNCDNLIITPHVGGYSVESVAATRRYILEKVIDQLKQP